MAKRKPKNRYYYDDVDNSNALVVLLIVIIMILTLLLSLFTYIKNNRVKVAEKLHEICPKCDGIVKIIGGTEYEIKLNIEVENEFKNITLGGNVVKFEKQENKNGNQSNKIQYSTNKDYINSGISYTYDTNLEKFKYNDNLYSLEEFQNFLKDTKFDYEFSKDDESNEIDIIDDLDVCFKDIIIDLGSHKVVRTYNLKFKNYIYIITFEDNLIVYDSSIEAKAYYDNELIEENKILYFEPNGEILDIKTEVLDKITYLDLDNEYKTPMFEFSVYNNLDLIDDEHKFNWFDEEFNEDYAPTLTITYRDILGNEYQEMIGLLICDYGVVYKGLMASYTFNVGEYERKMPTSVSMSNGESVTDLLVIDDSEVVVDEVGEYIVYYKIKSPYTNITHVRQVTINVVE